MVESSPENNPMDVLPKISFFSKFKFLFIIFGVFILLISSFFIVLFFNSTSANVKNMSTTQNNISSSDLKNLSWCEQGTGLINKTIPQLGETPLKLVILGGSILKGETLCNSFEPSTKETYYFNENMSRVYISKLVEGKRNLTLIDKRINSTIA